MANRRGSTKPVQDTLKLCNRAAEMVKQAGFILHCSSMQSAACYYKLPGKEKLLRIAEHSKRKRRDRDMYHLGDVVANITFNGNHIDKQGTMKITDDAVISKVYCAVGKYMLKCDE